MHSVAQRGTSTLHGPRGTALQQHHSLHVAAAAAAARRSGQFRQQQQHQADSPQQFIAPIDPVENPAAAGGQAAALPGYLGPAQPVSSRREGRPGRQTSGRHDRRRGSLVKIRVAPRRYRLRQSFDSPRPLHVRPGDPEFEGRLTSEINSVYGPRRLGAIIQDYAHHFTPSHAAGAISQLAGQVTGKELPPQELSSVYRGPAAKVARVFEGRLQQASLQDCARVLYGLARLQLHMPQLLAATEQATTCQLRSATPQALSGLAVGLAHWGYVPAESWVRELCLEAFAAMDSFTAQDLANLLFSLAVWRTSVSQPFLQRCLAAFRGHWGSAAMTPAAMVRFLYAVTQLPACQGLPPKLLEAQPPGAPGYIHHEEYRQQRELQAMGGAMGLHLNPAAAAAAAAVGTSSNSSTPPPAAAAMEAGPSQQQPSGVGSSHSSSTAVATYRLPSFNWLTACLSECRRLIDRFKPAELSTLMWSCACLNHTPDLIFMEAWYRAAAARMPAFSPATLAAAVQALGLLQPGKDVPGAVPGRWLSVVLSHSQELMQQQQQLQQQQQQRQQQQQQQQHQQQQGRAAQQLPAAAAAAAGEEQAPTQQQAGFSISDLSRLLWGLAELKFWPGKPWMEAWLQAAGPQLASATPADLSEMVWALARLRFCPPDDAWVTRLSAAISNQLQGFSVQGLAAVIWGYTRLGVRPDRLWLLRFRAAAAGGEEGSTSSQQLAQFVAAFLAQQNRQRFAEGPAVGGGRGGRGRQQGRGRGTRP